MINQNKVNEKYEPVVGEPYISLREISFIQKEVNNWNENPHL